MKLLHFCTLSSALAAAVTASSPHAAWSATATVNTESAASATSSKVGELIVTARRRAEDIQKVPIAITAFSQETLTEHAITVAYDLNAVVPGLSVTADSGNGVLPDFSIRGRGLGYQTAAGSVETYFADVPLSPPFQTPTLPPQFFDLQSLQVLKGPQGTLFGRNTTGGAVLFVPQPPTNVLGGYVRVQGGDYGDFQFEGALNAPLAGDKAILRIAGFEWHRDGYAHTLGGRTDAFGHVLPPQTYDNEDVTELRGTLLLRPADGLENSTILTYHTDTNRNTDKTVAERSGSALGTTLATLYPNLLKLGPYVADVGVNLTKPASEIWALINTTTYSVPNTDLTLKNIFGFVDAQGYTNDAVDVDGSPLTVVDLLLPARPKQNMQYTEELQVQGESFENRLNWIVGGLVDLTRQPGGVNSINVLNNPKEGANFFVQLAQSTFSSYSMFGSATYKFNDKFDVTAGVRNTWDNIGECVTESGGASDIQDVEPGRPLTCTSHQFTGPTYNVGVDYHATASTMLYGGYRHGYKRGGFNSSGPPATLLFQPETVDDFYAGVKSRFGVAGIRGRFDAEAYYDLYHNTQITSLSNITGFGLITLTGNAPEAVYRGLDADLALEANSWLQITASYSYIDADWTSWPDTSVAGMSGSLAVNPLPYAPRNKFSITPRFHVNLPENMGELAFAPTVAFQSRTYNNYAGVKWNNASAEIFGQYNMVAAGDDFTPAYTMVNLRMEWNGVMGSKVNLAANVTNLTNHGVLLGEAGILYLGVDAGSYGPPRMFTIEASTKF